MAQTIKLRRSAVAGNRPTTAQIDLGELAINTYDGKVYFQKSGSDGTTIQEVFITNTQNSGSLSTTGSITATSLSGSLNYTYLTNTPTLVSGSSQVIGILSSLNTYTGSNDTLNSTQNSRLTSIESATGSYETIGRNIVSGSSQLTSSYDTRYVISGSITQTTWDNIASKPDGIVSSSSQLTSSYDTRYTISGSVQPLPSNLISSSAQITAFGFVSGSSTIPTGTVSGSSQLTGSYDTRYVLSGSITQTTWDNIANKPAGIISSSTQLEGTTIQNLSGSFTGSFRGDGSNLTGVIAAGSGVTIASGSQLLGTAGQLNFTGSGVSVTINSGTASINITGGSGGSGGSSGLASTNTINFAQLSQSAAATTWSFTHNLDNAYPNITVYDNNNQVIQPLRIEAMTTASMNIVFSTSRTGYAVASIGGVSTQGTSKRLTVTTPSTTWTFQHNIGDKYPVFQIFDSNGDVIIPSRIATVDSGQAIIYFPYATTGTAIASVGGGLPSISSSYEGYTLQVQNGFATWQSIVSASVSNAVSSSYVLYSNVANKPTLVSGSSQVDITSTTGYTTFSSSIATSFSASSANVTLLSSSIASIDSTQTGRLNNLESKSASVDISISNINSVTSSNIGRLNNLETKSASVDISLSNINSLTSSALSRFSNLESKSASVDISISNLNSYTSSLKTAISLNGQDVTVNGNLNVAGTTTTLNSTTLNVGDNIIELNFGGTAVRSGIYTKDATGGSLVSGSILWDATNDYWVVGISGSESKILRAGGDSVVSGSSQVIGILSSLNSFTASNDITSLNSATSSYETKGRGIWSGSAQLPSGVVSGSSQILGGSGVWSGSAQLPTGIVSGSVQVDVRNTTGIGTIATTGSNQFNGNQYITGAVITTSNIQAGGYVQTSLLYNGGAIEIRSNYLPLQLNSNGATTIINDNTQISGSLRVSGSIFSNGFGLISGSSQILNGSGVWSGSAQLPTGVISGSAQLTSSYDTRYVVSGSITQTTWDNIASKPSDIVSGSSQLTSSYDLRYVISGSITQTTWDNIASKPAGIISGSQQVTSSLDLRYLQVGDNISTMVGYGTLALTGSNNFIGTQRITGSLSISGSLILDNANIDTSRYLHSQSAASTTWTVNHSLEYDYPSVTIYDNTNKVIIPDEITRISNNQLTITFASAESGNAHVSVGGISNLAGDRYLYTQSTPASTWTITHALNYKYVNVDVYDNNDQLMLPQTVTATNNNTLTLVFATPTSGNATISKGGAKILNGLNDLGNGSYQFTGSLVVTGEVDAQNFNTTSDISLKTNLELIENSLDKVEKLNGYTFDWVENYNNDGVKQIGMIAQEVYAVQPELVTKKEILIGNTYEEVMLLDYSKVTSLLIGAVKELSEKVKQLENKIGQ